MLAAGAAGTPAAAAATALAAESVRISIARIDHPAFTLRGLSLSFDAGRPSPVVTLARLAVGGRELRDLRIDCLRGAFGYPVLSCSGGRLWLARERLPWRIDLQADLASGEVELVATAAQGGRAWFHSRASGRVQARLERLPLAELAGLLGPSGLWLAEVRAQGTVDADLDWSPPSPTGAAAGAGTRMTLRGRVDGGGFDSAGGQQAAEGVALDFALQASRRGGGWQWSGHADWREGAVYWHPFFAEAGMRLQAGGVLNGERLEVRQASLQFPGVEAVTAAAVLDAGRGRLIEADLRMSGADLAVVGPRWLAPLAAPQTAERLRFAGRIDAGLRIAGGALQAVDVRFDEAGFSLPGAAGGGVAFGPVSGRLPWRADGSARTELQVGGGRWEKLALGPFSLAARIGRDRIEIERSRIPLLDGAVVLDGLALRRAADGWVGEGAAVVEPISMQLLTEAVGLPPMGGVLSASIPALDVRPGEISLGGALVVSVFDGYLQATGLRVREPFGAASYLSADVEARHIDLAQLTQTFSFGSITGFVDADVRGLELFRWRPARFDARIASSPGRYPRRISQRAVENIGALADPGAMAAIQRSVIGLFDTFGYRELGLRCVLEADVCRASGIGDAERADGGFMIVRGGGVPALDVIGYNRRIDWKELVERLRRVTGGELAPELR